MGAELQSEQVVADRGINRLELKFVCRVFYAKGVGPKNPPFCDGTHKKL